MNLFQENFQLELFQLLEIILNGWENVKSLENLENIQNNLYIVLLKSTAVGYEYEVLRNFGSKLLDQLSQENSVGKVSDLHSKYIKSALIGLDALDRSNDDSFEQIVVLHGIICLCGFQVGFSNGFSKFLDGSNVNHSNFSTITSMILKKSSWWL